MATEIDMHQDGLSLSGGASAFEKGEAKMRIVLIHPNYHSGGAEIAGNWPPAWAAYLAGALKNAGYDDVQFIDAMTNDLSDDELRAQIAALRPDIVGATSITPSIYTAERAL